MLFLHQQLVDILLLLKETHYNCDYRKQRLKKLQSKFSYYITRNSYDTFTQYWCKYHKY